MTAIEVLDYINKELDESVSVQISLLEGTHFINQALDDFFDKNLPNYEKDEWTRRAFLPLRVAVTPPNGTFINTSLFTDFALCAELSGLFDYAGKKTRFPIRPITDDTKDTVFLSAFAKPSNKSPKYQTSVVLGQSRISIFSTTPPTDLQMVYIRKYKEVDLVTNPNAVVDFDPFLTHKKIAKLAIPNILKTYEDPRFSPAIYEEQYAKQTPKIN